MPLSISSLVSPLITISIAQLTLLCNLFPVIPLSEGQKASTFVDAINALYFEPTFEPDSDNSTWERGNNIINFTHLHLLLSHKQRGTELPSNIATKKFPPPIAGTRAVILLLHINSPSITGILQSLFLLIRFWYLIAITKIF